MANRVVFSVGQRLNFKQNHNKNNAAATVFGVSLGFDTPNDAASFFVGKLQRKAWPIAAKRHDLRCFSLKLYCLLTKNDATFFTLSRRFVGKQ